MRAALGKVCFFLMTGVLTMVGGCSLFTINITELVINN